MPKISLSLSAIAVFVFTLGLSSVAEAHDANFARWDVTVAANEVVVSLHTAGTGLHHSMAASVDDDAIDWQTMPADDYVAHVEAFLRHAVGLQLDGATVSPDAIAYTGGHEATATLTFAAAAPSDLLIDLTRYTDRPNQHHLVFVTHDGARERFMLTPDAPARLAWSAAPPAQIDVAWWSLSIPPAAPEMP